MDLLLVVPRLAQKAGSFAIYHMPEAVDNIAGKIWSGGGSMIADATMQETVANMTITNTSSSFAQNTGGSMLEASIREAWSKAAAANESGDTLLMSVGHALAKLKNVGGIFSYLTSRWAITTFAVVSLIVALKQISMWSPLQLGYGNGEERLKLLVNMDSAKRRFLRAFISTKAKGIWNFGGEGSRFHADHNFQAIILNRTQFYASSREHLRLRWHVRAALYMIPICAFLYQMLAVLQTMKCQTSPFYPDLRYGDPAKHLAIDFAAEGGFLHRLSSNLLFWQDDASCCQAQNMSLIGLGDDKSEFRGSMSLLYWFFFSLCISQLFETLACALQGKQPMPETGMTIFEHSLAFAECEAMISSALGFGFFGITKSDGTSQGTGTLITRSEMLQRLNVPPEVLLVCLISCCSHISSAVLAITGIRHRVRLVNTGIWACCYMSAFFWSFSKIFMTPTDHVSDHLGILRFPTVCVVGFIPHMLILVGIVVCGSIYSLALLATAISVPSEAAEGLSFGGRFAWAYNNLQANVQFSQNSAIRIKMSEDFYTTLLKIGFHVLTAASEAVYLNEGSRIHVANMTWVERKRINDMGDGIDKRRRPAIPHELLGEGIARGVTFVDHQNGAISNSPYARERRSKPIGQRQKQAGGAELDTGLGMTQRRTRMQLTMDFVFGIKRLVVDIYARFFWFVFGHVARGTLSLLGKAGVARRPAWLIKAAGNGEDQKRASIHVQPSETELLGFYMIGPDGRLSLPQDDNVDVEVESRRRLQRAGTYQDEQQLDSELWKWFRKGGWFGEIDSSGDYEGQNNEDDDDTTSVVSMSTNASNDGEQEWEEEESGRRTPTQGDPVGGRDSSPVDADVDLSSLSRLLNPRTAADREEARLLSYRLQSNRPMTRSQYQRTTQQDRTELLDGLRSSNRPTTATEEEEETDLEQFILETRRKAKLNSSRAATWDTGAEGMGEGGPQCVVCQSTPRTVLVWPCGCLSMCDDCRVGLAARNYTKCICCRTDIVAYSRLYVP